MILTLLLVPVFNYYFSLPLETEHWQVMKNLLYAAISVGVLCFVVSTITNNHSQVDKLWSILPIGYVWYVCWVSNFNLRLVLMAALVTVWGARLTYNFSRKGAYQWPPWRGEEDYRWKVLRAKPTFAKPWKWTLFNLFFISLYQNLLILLFTLPTLVALQYIDSPLNVFDWLISLFMMVFIFFETLADEQHWKYQSGKLKKIQAGEVLDGVYKKGFLDQGLWSKCRHPNYFGEQSIWICFYLFSISAGGSWINWSIIGCILLILLFQGSARFSEEISVSKYPEYNEYQKKVPMFVPI